MDSDKIRFLAAIKAAELKGDEKVLDLGCGRCALKRFLPKSINYTGIDFPAIGKHYGLDFKNKEIIYANLEKGIPSKIKNRKFDVIFLLEVLEHIEHFKSLLIECKEILNKNGRIVITTPSNMRFITGEDKGHIHCFRKTNLKNLAIVCGLKIRKIQGAYIRIPFFEIYIPSRNKVYTEHFICIMGKE